MFGIKVRKGTEKVVWGYATKEDAELILLHVFDGLGYVFNCDSNGNPTQHSPKPLCTSHAIG